MGHTAAPLTHSSPPCFLELIVLLFLFLRGFVLLLRLCAVPGDDAGRCCRLLVAVVVLPLHPANVPASVHEAPDHHHMSCVSSEPASQQVSSVYNIISLGSQSP